MSILLYLTTLVWMPYVYVTLGLPVVGYWGFTPAGGTMDYTEAVTMPSYVPTSSSGLPDKMTFAQRASNLVQKAFWSVVTQ